MPEVTTPVSRLGPQPRGIASSDVERAADSLLRAGDRPTIDRIRQSLGKGSPNTINPMLDAWWKRLSARLDAGPKALHRLPESVAHVAEALWMQALDEGRRRAEQELTRDLRSSQRTKEDLEVRSHVLTLREGELKSSLRDRESTVAVLEAQLKELTLLLRKEQATRGAQALRLSVLEDQLQFLARRQPPKKPPTARTPRRLKGKPSTRRAAPHRRPTRNTSRKRTKPNASTARQRRK
jgi:hypothetical protein